MTHSAVAATAADAAVRALLSALEIAGARQRWRATLDNLLALWYWRGISEALGGECDCATLRRRAEEAMAEAAALVDIDLSDGLDNAAAQIDRLKPPGVVLRHGGIHVGTIPAIPWAEPLEGRHLRRVLKTQLSRRLAEALVLAAGLSSSSFRGAPASAESSGQGVAVRSESSELPGGIG